MSSKDKEDAIRVAEHLLMMQDNLKCAVCLETLQDAVSTRCGHLFCQLCINQIVKDKNASCPLCNSRVNRRSVAANEKLRNIVQTLNTMISSARQDFADLGIEDVFLLSKQRRPSSKESFSPAKPKTDCGPNAPPRRRHARVTTWLEQLGPSCPSQETSPSVREVENTPNDDSDSEMVSVSQIYPDQHSVPGLSAHIEEDGAADRSRSKVVTLRTKSSGKSLASKKTSSSKMKQKPLKSYISPAKGVCKLRLGSVTLEPNKNMAQDSIVAVDLEKENSNNPHPSRSPGWSRVKEMKKEFHASPAVLRIVNLKGNRSPVPAIEDPNSGEEEPCLNLSLTSPLLKKKAIFNDIVNSLESEIEIIERSELPAEKETEIKVPSSKLPPVQSNQSHLPLDGRGRSPCKPLVQFLKLGSIVSKRIPSVPIYLKGSLEHIHCFDISSFSYRLLLDAQTQTEVETTFRMPQSVKGAAINQTLVSSSQQLQSTQGRRSSDKNADHDVDMMDAETVVLSQNVLSDIEDHQTAEVNSPLGLEAAETHCSDSQPTQKSPSIISSLDVVGSCPIPDGPKQPLHTASIFFSQDEGSSQKKIDFEKKKPITSQVDLDDSCSSILTERRSKRVRMLCSSSDSDSDSKMSKEKRKRNRKKVLSDNEEDSLNPLNITAGDTMEILANIEAQLGDTSRNPSPIWSDPIRPSAPSCRTSPTVGTLQAHGDTSITQIDSDGDSEFINPTPQKQPSFMARSATQSDDIVPSSQPPAVLPTSPVQLLPKCHQELTVESPPITKKNIAGSPVIVQNSSSSSVSETLKEGKLPDICTKKNTELVERPSDLEKASASLTLPSVLKPVFVCSSIPQNQATQVDKLAQMVNGEFSSKFSDDTTHLIVRVDENNRADKTFKYLCAVAAGKWVVSIAWVLKCLDAKELVPEELFEALDASGEPGPRRSREAHRSHKKLFDGFEFCCVGDFPDLSKQQLEELLSQCGASVIPNPSDFSFQDRVIPLTVTHWDESKEEEYAQWLDRYSTPLVQHDWVLDCIGKYYVTSFSSMLLCDVTDDVFSSMGFPAYLYEFIDSEQ